MSKKTKSILTLFVLTFFVVTSFNITATNGRAYYSSKKALAKASTFSTYRAVITTNVLNIRKSPSTTGAIVGTYKKGNIVDIIGQSGSFLKTSKGYIHGSYAKKSTTSTPSRGTTAFQAYKVVITTSKLNIRKSASTSAAIAGYYTKGIIVDVTGQSGSFLKTSKGYISSAYTRKYTAPSTGTTPTTGGTTAFQPYKVKITTSKLNIRKGPGTNYSVSGYYTKGTIVDVTGVSGSFLKTSRGYISAAYTQKYTVPSTGTTPTVPTTPTTPTVPTTPTIPNTGFQPYKVTITTLKLNIRKEPSTSSSIVGSYSGGSVIDITGQSGSFLQTGKGYIASAYTQKYTAPSIPSRGDLDPIVYIDYIQVNVDTPLLMDVDGTSDERYAVVGKTYGVVGQVNGYYKIKIGKMYGYIPTSKAKVVTTTPKNKISLAWQYVYAKASNATYYNDANNHVRKSSADLGLDVISPTWFYMTGSAGSPSTINAAEKADKEYVRVAHRNGYEVWALFQEFNSDRAYKTFYDSAVKARVINQIVSFALQYNVDGVNIDYEGLGGIAANKEGFTLFVRDLSAQLKALGLNVSVDVVKPTVGSIYSSFTDRPALAGYVDYLIYMAYDEHYAGAKTAGSVGSFPWVEKGLKDIIAQGVPREKIILGVPFYLRDFTVKNTLQPYDAVIFSQDGVLYNKPFEYDNKLLDINIGYTYKYLETVSGWYKVELEGDIAYIPQSDSVHTGANTNLKEAGSSQNIVFPYDTVVMKEQSNVYQQPSQTAGVIGSINTGYAYKLIEATQDWYKIDYNGTEAYIMQKSGTLLPQYTSLGEAEASTAILVPSETVIVKSETGLYKQPMNAESEKAADVKVGESFKYLGTVPGMQDWYIVDYKGAQAYAYKNYTSFISANTSTSSSVVKSSAVSLKGTLDKVKQYGGRTYYDEVAKQNVVQYYVDGYWHIVWLEDTHSMAWRMDLINNYGLAGTGAWDLNWNPSAEIYQVIKSKLK